MRLQQGKYPRDTNVEVVVSEKVSKTTDPFALNTTLPLSLLEQWKSFFEKEARGFYYLEHGSHRYSTANLQDMVKMHFARDVQHAVQAELNWFAQPYSKPVNMEMYPPDNAIKEFQDLLYTRPFDKIHQEYRMTPDEMAKLCGKR